MKVIRKKSEELNEKAMKMINGALQREREKQYEYALKMLNSQFFSMTKCAKWRK